LSKITITSKGRLNTKKQDAFMTRLVVAMAIFLICIPSSPQEIQHQAVAINIEVPVRVFQGETFIDDLTLEDFELYEEGILHQIDAVYFVEKTDIAREETRPGAAGIAPKIVPRVDSRCFVLLFDILTYMPRVEQALDIFFNTVLLPSDRLMIITSMNVYHLKENSWEIENKKDLAEQFKGIIRKDAVMGNAGYRKKLKSLERLTLQISNLHWEPVSGGESWVDRLDFLLGRYESILVEMDISRIVSQKKLIQFADELKIYKGQKTVLLFYQREFIPQPMPKTLFDYQVMFSERQDLVQKLTDLFVMYVRDNINLDMEKIKQVYSESSIAIHFLFLTRELDEKKPGIYYQEHSEDIFNAFAQLAHASGGYTIASANALFAFNKAVEATEKYYLLYYTPKNYKPDGKFRNIKVRVKGRNYRVLHRAGYVAD
jgi:hypothetical protein